MSSYVTLSEAARITGKSESTLRRLAKDLKASKSKHIKHEKLKTGHFKILFDPEYLTKHFNSSSNSSTNNSMNNSESTQNEVFITMFETLKKELDEKNKQIETLLQRQHETNIILEHLQQKITLIEAPNHKKRWWQRK